MTEVVQRSLIRSNKETEEDERRLLADNERQLGEEQAESGGAGDKLGKGSSSNIICMVHAKRETTVWNLVALPITAMVAVGAGGYINANMPYLLRDEKYFNF